MKTSFYAQMLEYKQVKADCRRRGEMIGDHRGQLKERNVKDDYRDMDKFELELAALLHRSFTDVWHGFRHELEFIVADMNGLYADEIPF